ncbi:hypothetical protein AC579_3883 [Pseudocercospora musae]|uniref:Uncharacterized protein n=1 Tax=Pseudocercospora musae TaxID=113226 RepID=A0A139IS45_9PEZI|nr:hypothetical protein AC579_3883 [Pseudocercospora musae]
MARPPAGPGAPAEYDAPSYGSPLFRVGGAVESGVGVVDDDMLTGWQRDFFPTWLDVVASQDVE